MYYPLVAGKKKSAAGNPPHFVDVLRDFIPHNKLKTT
jgi:hypothetical protein